MYDKMYIQIDTLSDRTNHFTIHMHRMMNESKKSEAKTIAKYSYLFLFLLPLVKIAGRLPCTSRIELT